ncbi:MAG: hypothetical protein RBT64_14980, partial [Trichloromonas sp.]|nr:hypothetical protein [Trichloromonas sp.]
MVFRNIQSTILVAILLIAVGSSCSQQKSPVSEPIHPNLPSILEALAPVASGQGVPDALPYVSDQNELPKLVILDKSNPRQYTSGYKHWNWYLPTDWLPVSLDETDLVVVVKEKEINLGSQTYTAGPSITRYRWDLEVVVREAYSGIIVNSGILQGPEPENFPKVAPLEKTRIDGDTVSIVDLEEWLVISSELMMGRQAQILPLKTLGSSDQINTVNSITFSPDGEMIAIGSQDYSVRLLQVDDGTLLRTLDGHTANVSSVAFSSDGEILVSISLDNGTINVWRTSDGSLLNTIEVQKYKNQVAISPDGEILAVGRENTVQLLRINDGVLLNTFKGHKDEVSQVAFSPNGEILAS